LRESWQGITAKGAEYGLKESDFAQPYLFKSAVLKAAAEAPSNVFQLKSA
jgi:hypothetical protein